MSTRPLLRVSERFVLNLGYTCNARCPFCYYLGAIESGGAASFDEATLKRRVEAAVRWGKRAVDLSGGEPTVRPELPELVRHCRRAGLEAVTVISNGIRTADRDYCGRLAEAGLTEGLLSLHGPTGTLHDRHTGVPGSFEKALASIEHLHEAGLGVRTNTVVTAANLDSLPELLALLAALGLDVVNLLLLNPSQDATRLGPDSPFHIADLVRAGQAVDAALDHRGEAFRQVNVRFLPFCLLPRHLGSVRTQWQKLHEDEEWDPVLNVAFQRGFAAAAAAILLGSALLPGTPRYRPADLPTRLARALSAFRMRVYYRRGAPCSACSVRAICTGFPREVVRRQGFPEVAPIRLDAPVTDPLRFSRAPASPVTPRRDRPAERKR